MGLNNEPSPKKTRLKLNLGLGPDFWGSVSLHLYFGRSFVIFVSSEQRSRIFRLCVLLNLHIILARRSSTQTHHRHCTVTSLKVGEKSRCMRGTVTSLKVDEKMTACDLRLVFASRSSCPWLTFKSTLIASVQISKETSRIFLVHFWCVK